MIDANAVHENFKYALFNEDEVAGLAQGELPENTIVAEGVNTKVGFHAGRLEEVRNNVEEALSELPVEFQQNGGGGMSFLNACVDKNGTQWADMHQTVDELLTLGIALNKAAILMPRELWAAFPGGVPYFVVKE